ncbi:acetyltransferase [Sphingobacterium sp. JUb56]|uniref:acetyltransferase n=1 Tax=Sphingobacterium sp. JUb56 TaxID=2587145 RepID=UPI001607CC80|nr:acetyltransferase [Sphingobacterium sp. JUb56]MBB2954353.1 lipopolysaccharide O-acetyltransferase [Sphingobacterium sp. JUb56]
MYKRYGVVGSIKLIFSLLFTKIFYPKARLIRLPFDVRNNYLINIGKNLTTGFGCRFEAHPIHDPKRKCLHIGNDVQINDHVHIAAGECVDIGNDVLIASRVFISDLNHGTYSGPNQDSPLSTPNSRERPTKPVIISDNVWIGEGVCILSGVTIGKGSIIGALSVVTKNIPDYCIAVGSPARVIKAYNFEKEQWEATS